MIPHACFIVCATILVAQPSDPASALLEEAVALARSDRLQEAERVLNEGKLRYPADARFPRELAGIEFRRENMTGAKRFLRETLRLAPADAYANEFLGTLFLLDENLPAALKYWNPIGKPLLAAVEFVPEPRLDAVVRARTFPVSAGQLLTVQRLRRTHAGMQLLGIFASSQFDLSPLQDGRYRLTVRTAPVGQAMRGWPGRLLPLLRSLPYQGVHLDAYNIGASATNFTSLWRWDRQKRRVAMELSTPFQGWQSRVSIDARDEIWDLTGTYSGENLTRVTLRRAAAGIDFSRSLTERLRWTLGVGGTGRQIRGGAGSAVGSQMEGDAGGSPRVTVDNGAAGPPRLTVELASVGRSIRTGARSVAAAAPPITHSAGRAPFSSGWSAHIDNRLDYLLWSVPERRFDVNGWSALRVGRILTGFPSRLVGIDTGAITLWRPGAKGDTYTLTSELRAGALHGNVPLDDLFILGMERDNQLWLRGHVGTRDGRKGSAPMGTRYVLLRNDAMRRVFRFPLVRIDAGPFFDSGWTGDPSGRFGSRGWLYDTGVQATIRTIGNVKFSAVYGRNLRDGGGVFYTAVGR